MVKIGDKYYCIKDRYHYYNNINKAGKIYKVIRLNLEHDWVCLSTELVENSNNEFFYSLIDDYECYYFYEYFISIKEYRKLKLQKLC